MKDILHYITSSIHMWGNWDKVPWSRFILKNKSGRIMPRNKLSESQFIIPSSCIKFGSCKGLIDNGIGQL